MVENQVLERGEKSDHDDIVGTYWIKRESMSEGSDRRVGICKWQAPTEQSPGPLDSIPDGSGQLKKLSK